MKKRTSRPKPWFLIFQTAPVERLAPPARSEHKADSWHFGAAVASSTAKATLLALLSAALSIPAYCQTHLTACPGADAWRIAHPEESSEAIAERDAKRILTNPALRDELAERVANDQAARRELLRSRSPRAYSVVQAIDENNIRWLHALVSRRGFPTLAEVGEQGMHDAWVLAQHADRAPKFQAALLPALEQRHAQGELSADDLARFTDRVLVSQNKPQRYGTQYPPEEMRSRWFGLPDEQAVRDVDARRKALGVMPLADYACMMSTARLGG